MEAVQQTNSLVAVKHVVPRHHLSNLSDSVSSDAAVSVRDLTSCWLVASIAATISAAMAMVVAIIAAAA